MFLQGDIDISSPQIARVTKPSLARDWLDTLRYWLRGRRGVAVLVVSMVVIGGALNWSWLVAAGIAPLLITVLPCAAMCVLGLCMHKVGGGSCSTSSSGSDSTGVPTTNTVQGLATSDPVEAVPVSRTTEAGPSLEHQTIGSPEMMQATKADGAQRPDEQLRVWSPPRPEDSAG